MIITHDVVKKDIEKVMVELSDGNVELANPVHALKIASLYTLPCTIIHATLAFFIYFYISKASEVIWGFGMITTFSLVMTLILYPNSLVYLSVPNSVRASSIVLSKIKKTYVSVVVFMLLVNCVAAGMFLVKQEYIIAVPVVFFVGFFITQIVLGTEISRYGVGSLIEKMSVLAKNI